MSAPLLLSLREADISFADKKIFTDLSLNIKQNDKICLIGKNGAGKTTLMKAISAKIELDSGELWQSPGLIISHLEQEFSSKLEINIYDYLYSQLTPDKQSPEYSYLVDMVIEPFQLNPHSKLHELSGGQIRKLSLAKSLIEESDILLLDEPTNHLDLAGIKWLEDFLNSHNKTFICISHDKRFLENISNKVFWLDRGQVRVCPKGFSYFTEWQEQLLTQEERELENRQKSLNIEEKWMQRGVTARRKRNVRRLNLALNEKEQLKKDLSSFRKVKNTIKYAHTKQNDSSHIIVEFFKINKKYNDKIIFADFSYQINKGDRIGVIGNNGAGKTSFLKLLLQEITPDSGKVKQGKNIEISYFSQNRENLKLNDSLWKNLSPSGNDYIKVSGKDRHVIGYLRDFLFEAKQATDLVATLSGGQKNRLLLAKTLANPGNVLILDEPTNDLDMDSLEMLTDIIANFKGTLIIVSHDRDFLDQTVNKLLVFKGNGLIDQFHGGYSEYLDANKQIDNINSYNKPLKKEVKSNSQNIKNKLSYKDKHKLEKLPTEIAKIEAEIKSLQEIISAEDFYEKEYKLVEQNLATLSAKQEKLELLENSWLELSEYNS